VNKGGDSSKYVPYPAYRPIKIVKRSEQKRSAGVGWRGYCV
jgi:hypothetical protein